MLPSSSGKGKTPPSSSPTGYAFVQLDPARCKSASRVRRSLTIKGPSHSACADPYDTQARPSASTSIVTSSGDLSHSKRTPPSTVGAITGSGMSSLITRARTRRAPKTALAVGFIAPRLSQLFCRSASSTRALTAPCTQGGTELASTGLRLSTIGGESESPITEDTLLVEPPAVPVETIAGYEEARSENCAVVTFYPTRRAFVPS